MLLVLIFSTVLFLIVFSAMRLAQFKLRMVDRSHSYKQAMAVAEAGLEYAIHEINQNQVGEGSSWAATQTVLNASADPVGQFEVTLATSGGDKVIESTGYIPSVNSPDFRRTVRITIDGNTGPPYFEWAIYSEDYLGLGGDYLIDSYDSGAGPYPGPAAANSYANIGAGGNGNFGGNINLNGSMQLGGTLESNSPNVLGDDSEGNANQLITGDPPTPPPTFPDAELAAVQASNDNAQITINGSPFGGGTSMVLVEAATIVIPPGDYFFTNIQLGSDTVVRVEPPGEVRMYMESSSPAGYALELGSYLNWNVNTALPTNFQFFIKQGLVEIQSNTTFYAGMYAPNSEVTIQSDTNYYGAVVGGTVELQSNENFHYDEALGSPSGFSGNVLVTSWVEVTPQ